MSNPNAKLNQPYLVSNENLRAVVAVTPNAQRVLTIAGSGDQALFYTLNGATQIDTFDIRTNARVIQDIKTAAITSMSHDEYITLIKALNRRNPSRIIPQDISAKLPTHLATAAQNLTFCNTIGGRYTDSLTAEEYARLQATLRQPFNFIYEDLADIHNRVTGPYDVINISNIFDDDYISNLETQFKILTNLTPLLRVGGTIVYNNQRGKDYSDQPIKQSNGTELQHTRLSMINSKPLDLFQRTR